MTQRTQKARQPKVLELASVELDKSPIDLEIDDGDPLPPPPRKGLAWLGLLGAALSGLAVLGLSLWAENLVRTLLERQPLLGAVAFGLLGLAAIALLALVIKEITALARLRTLDGLRNNLQAAYDARNTSAAGSLITQLARLYAQNPRTAAGRADLARQRQAVLDAQDLIIIAEESLMQPLDREAVRLVSTAARRVSLVTALSPRALVDIAMVAFQCISLTRQIAQLYGARPGVLGAFRLARHMMAHLAITGGIAATEGLVSQVLGHSLAARLSARLGEGVINGLLTARVGIAAIAVTRPMPYLASKGPTLSEVTKGIAGFGGKSDEQSDKD